MNVIRYRPIELWRNLENLFEQISDNKPTGDGSMIETVDWSPAVDIKENENSFVIHADLPGIDKDKVQITMENNVLTIQGERREEREEKHKGYMRTERTIGKFYRRFVLPEVAGNDNIAAKMDKGVLEITVPKKEAAKPRLIKVEG